MNPTQPGATATRPRTRLHWIDLLRGTAVFLVILHHAINMPHVAGWPVPGWLSTATKALEPFRLPMLLVVSGMFLPRALKKPVGTYVDGKVRNLLWPLLLWTPITVFAYHADRVGDPSIWVGPSHLWYLKTMVFCYAVALLGRWIPLWVFPAAFLTILFTELSNDMSLFWYGSFFFIGALVEPLTQRLQRSPRWVFGLLLGATVAGSYLHVTQLAKSWTWPSLGISLIGVAALVWIAPRIPRSLPVQWLERMGRNSIVYYVVHLPVMALALGVMQALGAGTFTTIGVLAFLGLAVPFVLRMVKGHEILFSMPKNWYRRVLEGFGAALQQRNSDARGERLRSSALDVVPAIR